MTTILDSSLPQRPLRGSVRDVLERAAASGSFVATRSSVEEFRARAAALIAGHAQLTVVSDSCEQDVLVTSSEQARRLQRLHGKRGVLAARTEAACSQLIDAPGDGCDEAFMLGATDLSLPAFAVCEAAFLRRAGRTSGNLGSVSPKADALLEHWGLAALAHNIRAELVDGNEAGERALRHGLAELARVWQRSSQLQTFGEAVADMMNWPILDSVELPMPPAQWRELAYSRPRAEVRERADVLGILPSWDDRHARTSAGFCPVRSGIDYAIARSLAAAPYADVLWLVAPSADNDEARRFAEAISARYPNKLLAYELSADADLALAELGAGRVHDFDAVLAAVGFSLHVLSEDGACARFAGDCVHLT